MEKVIRKRLYSTEKATLVGKNYVGSWGDPSGYEERLYETEDGFFFLYGIGGCDSIYPSEKITTVSKVNAEARPLFVYTKTVERRGAHAEAHRRRLYP